MIRAFFMWASLRAPEGETDEHRLTVPRLLLSSQSRSGNRPPKPAAAMPPVEAGAIAREKLSEGNQPVSWQEWQGCSNVANSMA
jgi:hypothetical protein